MIRRMPEKFSAYWLLLVALLFGGYFLALRGSRLIMGLEITQQNLQGFAILALLMSLAVVAGGFFGARVYSATAFIFSGIGVAFLLAVSGTQPYEGWSDLISVVGFMFWGGLAIGAGIIVQLIYSIQASRKKLKEILAKEALEEEFPAGQTEPDVEAVQAESAEDQADPGSQEKDTK